MPNPTGNAIGRSDYVGCAGGMGVTQNAYWDHYRGVLTNRSRNTLAAVLDGTSLADAAARVTAVSAQNPPPHPPQRDQNEP